MLYILHPLLNGGLFIKRMMYKCINADVCFDFLSDRENKNSPVFKLDSDNVIIYDFCEKKKITSETVRINDWKILIYCSLSIENNTINTRIHMS